MRDIGAEVARSIREYFDEPRNRKRGQTAAQAQLDIEPMPSRGGRGALRDKSFVLTGTLESDDARRGRAAESLRPVGA